MHTSKGRVVKVGKERRNVIVHTLVPKCAGGYLQALQVCMGF